jgi:hypothetical protein
MENWFGLASSIKDISWFNSASVCIFCVDKYHTHFFFIVTFYYCTSIFFYQDPFAITLVIIFCKTLLLFLRFIIISEGEDFMSTVHNSVGSPFCVQAAYPPAMSVMPVKPCSIE